MPLLKWHRDTSFGLRDSGPPTRFRAGEEVEIAEADPLYGLACHAVAQGWAHWNHSVPLADRVSLQVTRRKPEVVADEPAPEVAAEEVVEEETQEADAEEVADEATGENDVPEPDESPRRRRRTRIAE